MSTKEIVEELIATKKRAEKLQDATNDQVMSEEIYDIAHKMSLLLVSFSPMVVDAKQRVDEVELEADKVFTNTYLEEVKDNSQKNAEMIARQKRNAVRTKRISLVTNYMKLADFRKDLERLVMGLNLRLSMLKVERAKSL